jgi:2'-5' RNA ligase
MTQYAIVAFPETDALEIIEGVRRRFDPQAGLIAAHLTFVFPFESEHSSMALRSHVARIVARVPAFQCQLEGVRISDSEYLYLDVNDGRHHALSLHERLYTGLLAEYWSAERQYEPHVTLGRIANRKEREDAWKYATEVVPPTNATIRELVVFRLDGPGKGEIDSRVPLPGNL